SAQLILKRRQGCPRSIARRDRDLLIRRGRRIPSAIDTSDARPPSIVDDDLAKAIELDASLEKVGIRDESDLHKDALDLELMNLAGHAILVAKALEAPPIAEHLLDRGAPHDARVVGCRELFLQDLIGSKLFFALKERNRADDTGEIERGFDAGISSANHRDRSLLEERAIAMRAVGDASRPVFGFAWHAHRTIARTGCQDDLSGFESRPTLKEKHVRLAP